MIPWFLIFYMERKFIGEGRRKKEIYIERDRKRKKKRKKKQGPACLFRRSAEKRTGVLGAYYNSKAFKTIQENSWDT